MSAIFLLLVALADRTDQKERPPHPLAPSLPQLTREEEKKIQAVIDRFIEYDIGKVGGAQGRKALEDFNKLGPDAIFQLIDSFNGAANLEHSCPAVIIGKKIGSILGRTKDMELLAFAKENLGAGVSAKRHLGVLKDLQAGIVVRRGAVQREMAFGAATFSGKLPGALSTAELTQAARKEKGARLQTVLTEAGKRSGKVSLEIFSEAASRTDKDARDLGQGFLVSSVSKQKDAELRSLLKHEKPEVRAAAAPACASRKWGTELIDLLEDPNLQVRTVAHQALVRLNNGKDLGPESLTSPGELGPAVQRWRAWWSKR